jgi:hypothetical protein
VGLSVTTIGPVDPAAAQLAQGLAPA